MYLKTLKVAGFKSFADRSRLEYRPGVTVIVGPNGSGKSNLVDALSWVLGSQSTKSLRTARMEDVIFAGTTTRPALGKAEVTLVVDNGERQIDLDLDEISITRRLYRDGSSDYELNGVACRLLDIQDLLSDSGVGRHQHVIIGQGEIGKVLNASAEEHRAVIEEAAGILKHRRRKERAERRLERTDEDVLRLRDLLGEIQRQMRPLRRQARAADRYQGLKDEVRALRLYLARVALDEHGRELTVASSEKSHQHESLEVSETQIRESSARLAILTESAGQVGADLDRDTSAAAWLETTNERLGRIASVARERRRVVSGWREAQVERRQDLRDEDQAIRTELSSIRDDHREAKSAAREAEARFRRLEQEEMAVATQTALSPEGAQAAVRGELAAIESAAIRDQRERNRLQQRLQVLAAQRRDELSQIDALNREIRTIDEELSALQSSYEEAAGRSRHDQALWETAEERLGVLRLENSAAESRCEALRSAMEDRDDPESRRVLEQSRGVMGSLRSQLDVPQDLENAVDAALGGWADSMAFDDFESVKEVVGKVKSTGADSVPVVSAMSEISCPARDVAPAVGLEALVDRLGPDMHRGLASRLLGDVVLVEGWVTGWDLIARHPALRAVTPEGDVISVKGVRMARARSSSAELIAEAERSMEQAALDMARAESIQTATRRDFEKGRQAERSALERLEEAEAGLAGRSEAMGRLQQSVYAIEQEQDRLEERQAALTAAIDEASGQMDELRVRLDALEGEEAERLRAWDELETRRLQLAADREVARSEWQNAAVMLQRIADRERILRERLSQVDAELEQPEGGAGANTGALSRIEAIALSAGQVLERKIEELRERQSALRLESTQLVADLERTREAHDSARSGSDSARQRIAELDVRLTELRLHRESILESIRRDADADEEAAVNAPRPDVADDIELDELVQSKMAQLARLGPINPLAAGEYRSLEERHDFLAAQLEDVESSRSELRKVISVLQDEIEQRFAAAFEEVASAYERYFGVLFPGGRGRIRLEDPEDLQSGVIIDAQPLGKKLSRMTLLSGGERSLAALAFLFAVFDARPSPFYVLDEVEAALDDSNLRRFLRIVDEFRRRAQLIIVTHQQQTMEAADVLYGVTMEPGGSSQAIRKEMRTIALTERVA